MEYLQKIISIFGGKKSALASKLVAYGPKNKLTGSHINNWIARDKKIPSEWIIPLARAVDFNVTPHELRPDIYPHPEDGLPDALRCQCVHEERQIVNG